MNRLVSKKRANYVLTKLLRILSIRVAHFCLRFPVTANQLTIGSFFVGVLSALCFTRGELAYDAAGVFLFLLAYFFDFVDGDVARLKNSPSLYGEWLDAISGKIETVLLYVGICIGQSRAHDPTLVWILGFLGISGFYVMQCLLYKNQIIDMKTASAQRETEVSSEIEAQAPHISSGRMLLRELLIGGLGVTYFLVFGLIFRSMMVFLWAYGIYHWGCYFIKVYFKHKRLRAL